MWFRWCRCCSLARASHGSNGGVVHTASDRNLVATYFCSLVYAMCTRHTHHTMHYFNAFYQFQWLASAASSWCKMQYSVGSYFSMSPRLIVERSGGEWPMQMCVNCAEKFNKEGAGEWTHTKKQQPVTHRERGSESQSPTIGRNTYSHRTLLHTETPKKNMVHFRIRNVLSVFFFPFFSRLFFFSRSNAKTHIFFWNLYARSAMLEMSTHVCACDLSEKCTTNKTHWELWSRVALWLSGDRRWRWRWLGSTVAAAGERWEYSLRRFDALRGSVNKRQMNAFAWICIVYRYTDFFFFFRLLCFSDQRNPGYVISNKFEYFKRRTFQTVIYFDAFALIVF